ncbi:MAG: hypothetical protein ABIS03_10405 [Gemmatimonadaceae bacterium]
MFLSLEAVEALFAPWQALYGDSTIIPIAVTALHLMGMLIGGGLAIGADRSTLRISHEVPGERDRHLGELNAIHRPVMMALSLLFVTGLAMLASDIATFLVSPVLWIKLGLVALLVINGVVLERTETALRRRGREGVRDSSSDLWPRLRIAAMLSIFLWLATLVAGTTLVSAA